jgi:F0F1-type ATP synthase membrane subunit b/b'
MTLTEAWGWARKIALSAALVGAPVVALASEEASGEAAAINWWHWSMETPPLGWFLIDFALFVFLIVYVARKPMRVAFARRHLTIKQTIADNEAAYARADETFHQSRDKLAAIDHDVTELIAQIKDEGGSERDRIIAAGRAHATRLQQDSRAIVAQEASGAGARLRRQTASRVLELAQGLLARHLTEDDQLRLLDQAIAEIESGATGGAVLELRPRQGSPGSPGGAALGGTS